MTRRACWDADTAAITRKPCPRCGGGVTLIQGGER